ncbi:Tubulin-folding cofactor A [Sesamum alatum]|uniref:Tubulin-specific chaperone A n=1 Tax=Sesamum alatum TaxID=300844 RepID=A0AAE1XVA7_9LAMI|nr:Tubulin-folding cofactor A [Sesamum alatum]
MNVQENSEGAALLREREVERERPPTLPIRRPKASTRMTSSSSCSSSCTLLLICLFVENVLAESRMMIPDCHKRLEAARGDLKGTLVELEESGHKNGLEVDDARSIITEVEQLLQSSED